MKRIIFIALMFTACCNNPPKNMETPNQIFPKGEVIDNDYFSGPAWLKMLVTDKENFDIDRW